MSRTAEVVKPDPALLAEFLTLRDASARRILAYARRWGTLEFCAHGLPAGHPDTMLPHALSLAAGPTREATGECWSTVPEPIEHWRFWASAARSIADLGSRLRRGQLVPFDVIEPLTRRAPWVSTTDASGWDWGDENAPAVAEEPIAYTSQLHRAAVETFRHAHDAEALDGLAVDVGRRLVEDRASMRGLIEHILTMWIELARVSVGLTWERGRPEVVLTGRLFGSIGTRLLFAVAATGGFGLCDGCGQMHVPARPNDPRRRSFCSECRANGEYRRIASRDSYARRKRQQEAADGAPRPE